MFQNNFTKIGNVHTYGTRNNVITNFYLPPASKKAGQIKLQERGTKLWNTFDKNLKYYPYSLSKNNTKIHF